MTIEEIKKQIDKIEEVTPEIISEISDMVLQIQDKATDLLRELSEKPMVTVEIEDPKVPEVK